MTRLTIQTLETVSEEAKPRLEAVQKANGFVPNLIGVLANSPQALQFYQEIGKLNAQNSLTPTEIEVVQITSAVANGCGFCVAGHTKIATKLLKLPQELINALRECATIGNEIEGHEKYQALAQFTLQLIDNRGQVSDEQLANFKAVGYSDQNVLDVVSGVALATLCNYANNVAQSEINPELQPFA